LHVKLFIYYLSNSNKLKFDKVKSEN